MALRAEYTMQQSDLGDFLYETIREDRNGAVLSVLSAFARLDMDPWQEAARLAAMPRDAAAASLARILDRLPPADPEQADQPGLARRLVELLPKRHTSRPAAQQGQIPAKTGRGIMNVPLLLAFAIVFGLLQVILQLF